MTDVFQFILRPEGEGKELLTEIIIFDNQEIILGRKSVFKSSPKVTDPDSLCISRSHLKVYAKNKKVYISPCSQNPKFVYLNNKSCQNNIEIEIQPESDIISLFGMKNKFNFRLFRADSLSESDKFRIISTLKPPMQINPGKNEIFTINDSPSTYDQSFTTTDVKTTKNSDPQVIKIADDSPEKAPAPAPVEVNLPLQRQQSEKYEKQIESISANLECSICLDYMALAHTAVPW
jgi:hypothetical protein